MDFNTWWRADPRERFWLEITDRKDLGVDLHAPQVGANGREQWHYSLIKEVADGDVVFHYHRAHGEPAISAWSKASGSAWEGEVFWAPHAGARHDPVLQPGWWLGLEGFHRIDPPVTFADIRANEELIRVLESELEDRYSKPLYTPFETGDRAIRPKQAYLAKLPADLVDAFEPLRSAASAAAVADIAPSPVIDKTKRLIGEAYRRPDENATVAESDPFARDPALLERAHRAHRATQNALADFVKARGIDPRSPRADEPNYDLAWTEGKVITVVEVKSIHLANEERQLRLALGQVLRYRQVLRVQSPDVRAVIATSAIPGDPSWIELCNSFGVVLTWPGGFDKLVS